MTNTELEIARNQLVVKSNNLIQKSRYTLSLQQQKIILYIISKIKPEDEELKEYEFDLYGLCDLCGIEHHGQNYQNFKDSMQKLHDNSFWLETDKELCLISWVNYVRIDKNTQRVRLRLDDRLKPYLLQLRQQFTAYELGSVLQMQSKYSIRIYELLKSYVNVGSVKFELEEFKKILGLKDVYADYRNFRRYVIDKSMEEINQYSDLNISFFPLKAGKRVHGLLFEISQKDEYEIAKLRLIREKNLKKK